jgi:Leucine-rich repeat (LRR) protein
MSRSFVIALICALLFLPVKPVPPAQAQSPEEFLCIDAQIQEPDCEALVALYNSTNGPAWIDHTNWLVTLTPSDWFGVTVDEFGHVSQLNLEHNGLVGSLPREMRNLPGLTQLNLSGNQLGGAILPELGSLSNLVNLYLDENLFSGSIPVELGSLSSLAHLDLSDNQLSGPIPPELGNLFSLVYLFLNSNQLSGDIPSQLGNLTYLERLYLFDNLLTGSIPVSLGSLTHMWNLWLSGNQLTGLIPPELGQLSSLVWLRLADNQLSGTIPQELGALTGLWQLSLGNNQLTGEIPTALGDMTNLLILSLVNNQLTGSIPVQLGALTNLYELDLSSNQLSGIIPPELGSLTNLEILLLNDNALTGDIPDITSLIYLLPPGELDGGDGLNLDYNALTVPEDYVNPGIPLHVFLDQYDPDWHTLQAFEQVIGSAGGMLTSLDGRAAFSIPSGALAGDTTFTYTPQPFPSHDPGALVFANHSFQLTAEDALGSPVTDFAQPITVTITSTDPDLLGLLENSLALYDWDPGSLTWQDAATTCSGGATTRDLVSNIFSLPLCHLSEFAVFGNPPLHVFLPLITR